MTALNIQQALTIDDSGYALGDLNYHLGWTFRRAGADTSTEPRRVMTTRAIREAHDTQFAKALW